MLIAARRIVLSCLVSLPLVASAQEDFVNHVVFNNSPTAGTSFYTGVRAVEPSFVETENNRLPVEGTHFVSPPNALRLTWTSMPGGSWDAEIRTVSIDNRVADFRGDTLSLWLYSGEGLEKAKLPKVQLVDRQHNFTYAISLAPYVNDLAPGKWTRVRIPLQAFQSASIHPFHSEALHSVFFLQGDADGKAHTLFVDEINIDHAILESKKIRASLPATPRNVQVKGYERHVEVSWEPVDSKEVEYYLIYRAEGQGDFAPVGIQYPGVHRFVDFVGVAGKKFRYKVATVDKGYRQSVLSTEISAETREFSDDELVTMLEEECFRYYWEAGSHPQAGMALENYPGDPRIVATGASGFGIMALIVGMDRGFIPREQGIERLNKIVTFLEKADRYHGVWPHFLDGSTGKAMPMFGMFDDGGDLVESAFLVQGLLAARQYLNRSHPEERLVADRITHLWETVEWDWYAGQPKKDALIWHWSPQWSWRTNHRLTGFNETMIAYLLAIASPTHGVSSDFYYTGWANQDKAAMQYRAGWSGTTDGNRYQNGHTYQGVKLDVGVGEGGPLFFTQYSFLGMDPHLVSDSYTNYFKNNRNIALINYRYCVENPKRFKGYGASSWGLTASDDPYGYQVHTPSLNGDNGTITPTASLASFPYTPKESMAALKYFYRDLGDRLWGVYGPKDAFNLSENWFSPNYLGLDQAPIVVMAENARSGLIWKLFMSNPEIKPMLDRIRTEPKKSYTATGGE